MQSLHKYIKAHWHLQSEHVSTTSLFIHIYNVYQVTVHVFTKQCNCQMWHCCSYEQLIVCFFFAIWFLVWITCQNQTIFVFPSTSLLVLKVCQYTTQLEHLGHFRKKYFRLFSEGPELAELLRLHTIQPTTSNAPFRKISSSAQCGRFSLIM